MAMAMSDADAGSKDMEAMAAGSSFDFSCLEENGDDECEDLNENLDPATFRSFVESAVKELNIAEKPPVHSGEGGAAVRTGARLGYNTYVGQLPRLVVKPQPPFVIIGASLSLKEVLGFSEREMVGRTMNIVQGPMTNVAALSARIQAAADGEFSEDAFILYNNKGEDRVVTVDFEPEVNIAEGETVAVGQVILTIEHGDWVPKKIADAEDGRAKVTVKAAAPYNVLQTSPSFLEMYGLKEALIVGRTLNVVFGPRTDANNFRSLLEQAKKARTQHVDMWTCRPSDMSHLYVRVTIFPVMDKGEIGHYMVVFKKDESAGSPAYTSPRRQRPGQSPLSGLSRMTVNDDAAGNEGGDAAGAGPA